MNSLQMRLAVSALEKNKPLEERPFWVDGWLHCYLLDFTLGLSLKRLLNYTNQYAHFVENEAANTFTWQPATVRYKH